MAAAHTPSLILPNHKEHTRNTAISTIAPSPRLILPLNQHRDTELTPCVTLGQRVRAHDVIAKPAHPLGASLHAPVSGIIDSIAFHPTPTLQQQSALSIVLSYQPDMTSIPSPCEHGPWQDMNSISLCELIASGGIVGLGGAVFPTATKLALHAQHTIEQIIINGMECEPYLSCDDRLMREHARDILQGVQIAMHACQTQQAFIAIESDKPEAVTALSAELDMLNDSRIHIRVIPMCYPSGDEKHLIRHITGRELSHKQLPAEAGCIVSNVATIYACARWILNGEPLTSRIVTVSGNGITRPGNYRIHIGTPIHDVLQHCGAVYKANQQLIMGGPMMGQTLANANYPVVKATNALILADDRELDYPSAEQPCIRCGECATVCPAQLLPQQLLVHSRHGNLNALRELGLYDCIECGCCDYVCPSHIRLATRFREAKRIN